MLYIPIAPDLLLRLLRIERARVVGALAKVAKSQP